MISDAAAPVAPAYKLRLVVAGGTFQSRRAVRNLHAVCDKRLPGNVDLEVVDIFQQPELARHYDVIAAPTLIRLLPLPTRRIIGDLSNEDQVVRGLGLAGS
jgi:circadian clock protein KaiB